MSDTKSKAKRVGRPPLPPEEKERRKQLKMARDRERYAERKALLDIAAGRETDAEIIARQEKALKSAAKEEAGKVKSTTNGGAREGAGRPKGRTIIYSYASVRKMEELGFDPLEKLTQLYNNIVENLTATETNKDGIEVPVVKVGSLAHATMLGHLKGISDSLAKYSYRAVPERKEVDMVGQSTTMITLTGIKPKVQEAIEGDYEDVNSQESRETEH